MTSKKQLPVMIVTIDEIATVIAVQQGDNIVYSSQLTVNTKTMDEAVAKFFEEELSLLIGTRTAKAVRTELGSACQQETHLQMRVRGRSIRAKVLEDVIVTDEQIRRAIAHNISAIINGVQAAIEQIPIQIRDVIVERGILLRGAGRKLRGLDRILSQKAGLPVSVAQF